MKTKLNRIPLISTFAALCLCALVVQPVSAQLFYPVVLGGTNVVAAATTNTYTAYITTRYTRLVGIEERFKMASAATDDIVLHCDGSLDGLTFVNDVFGPYTNAATGVTAQTNVISLDSGAYMLLRLRLANTAAAVVLTNAYLAGTVKDISGGTVTDGTFSDPTLTGTVTVSGLTASLPVFTDASKALVSKTVANTLLALGIQSGDIPNSTNSRTLTFGTAFSAAPRVLVTLTNAFASNYVASITVSNFVVGATTGTNFGGSYIAIGAP